MVYHLHWMLLNLVVAFVKLNSVMVLWDMEEGGYFIYHKHQVLYTEYYPPGSTPRWIKSSIVKCMFSLAFKKYFKNWSVYRLMRVLCTGQTTTWLAENKFCILCVFSSLPIGAFQWPITSSITLAYSMLFSLDYLFYLYNNCDIAFLTMFILSLTPPPPPTPEENPRLSADSFHMSP
jgi:hypothetical protein